MDKVLAILNALDNWSNEEIIEAWNEYCDDNHYSNNIYTMDMLGDIFQSSYFVDNLEKFYHFDKNDRYFTFDDSTGLWNTISSIYEVVDVDDLAMYIYNTEKAFGDDDIEDILREED
jgi:hypothetical protein